jgi:hypothetical protein
MVLRTLLGIALAFTLVACGPTAAGGGDDDAHSQRDGGTMTDGGDDWTPPQSDASTNVDYCPDEAKLVYVIDENGLFSSFNPRVDPPEFTDLGVLNCPRQSLEHPYSMSVDRDAIAWVLSNLGNLFRVDIKNGLACTKTNFVSGQSGMEVFGMGFVTNTSGGTVDTLFIAGGTEADYPTGNGTLGTITFPDLTVTTIKQVSGWPELTGNSKAELWGFYPDVTAPKVARIDKTTAVEDPIFSLPQLAGQGSCWAFAFWGGDFWVFLAIGSISPPTAVHRVNGTDGTMTTVIADTGRRIVGAGVSTCAPIVIE